MITGKRLSGELGSDKNSTIAKVTKLKQAVLARIGGYLAG